MICNSVNPTVTPSLAEPRYFVSYTGVKLPLQLMSELEPASLKNRNTYFRAWFDAQARPYFFEKVTYGEVELSHRYEYHAEGGLQKAIIVNADDETTTLHFNPQGQLLETTNDGD